MPMYIYFKGQGAPLSLLQQLCPRIRICHTISVLIFAQAGQFANFVTHVFCDILPGLGNLSTTELTGCGLLILPFLLLTPARNSDNICFTFSYSRFTNK
jgi:hypothetical protein